MKKIVNNANEKTISLKDFSPTRDQVVISIRHNGDVCLLTTVKGFGGNSYGWLILFQNTTEHNMYSGYDNWDIRDAISSGLDAGEVFVVDSIEEFTDLIRGDGWGV